MNIEDLYVSYAAEEGEEILADITSDTDFRLLQMLLATKCLNYVKLQRKAGCFGILGILSRLF